MEETKDDCADYDSMLVPREVIPETRYEEMELLTQKELDSLKKRMPYSVLKSLKLAEKGELPQISRPELEKKIENYLKG